MLKIDKDTKDAYIDYHTKRLSRSIIDEEIYKAHERARHRVATELSEDIKKIKEKANLKVSYPTVEDEGWKIEGIDNRLMPLIYVLSSLDILTDQVYEDQDSSILEDVLKSALEYLYFSGVILTPLGESMVDIIDELSYIEFHNGVIHRSSIGYKVLKKIIRLNSFPTLERLIKKFDAKALTLEDYRNFRSILDILDK